MKRLHKSDYAVTAAMVNGGKSVPGYTEYFICVDQVATCGSQADSPQTS